MVFIFYKFAFAKKSDKITIFFSIISSKCIEKPKLIGIPTEGG